MGTLRSWAADDALIGSIEKVVLRKGVTKGESWFHPRSCVVPTKDGPMQFMTLQSIRGSDYFGPVHWTTSMDLGKTWSDFQPAPPLGWEKLPDGGHEGVCDVTPEYHPEDRQRAGSGAQCVLQDDSLSQGPAAALADLCRVEGRCLGTAQEARME